MCKLKKKYNRLLEVTLRFNYLFFTNCVVGFYQCDLIDKAMQNVVFFYLSPSLLSLNDVLELFFCSYDRHIQYIHDTYILNVTSQKQTPVFTGEQDWAVLKYFEEVFPLNQRFCCQLTIIRCPAFITALCFLQGVITSVMVHIFTYIWISSLQELSSHLSYFCV